MSAGHKIIRYTGPGVTRRAARLALAALTSIVLAAILSGLFGAPIQATHASTLDDSDDAPAHSNFNPGDWGISPQGESIPIHPVPTTDGRDLYSFEITEEGRYHLALRNAPEGVGVWSISNAEGEIVHRNYDEPFCDLDAIYGPDRYTLEIRRRDGSTGNTGTYTITLVKVTGD